MDKLTEIMEWKRSEVADYARPVREQELSRLASLRRSGPTFKQALERKDRLSVIAEIKRRSPSAGAIAQTADAQDQARKYYNAGADAISVLTDEKYFGGNLNDLWNVTDLMDSRADPRPCLRKDFMVHPVQIIEAAEAGARAILIIVRALSDEDISTIHNAAKLASLDSLFEIHNEKDLERALQFDAEIIGVNNRNLGDFSIDISISERLFPKIPDTVVKISESGFFDIEDVARARDAGADAVLIGEALMVSNDIDRFMHSLQAL